MASKFKKQLTETRRAFIMKAAIEVIAEQGFQNTTIKQIAARAEVADGTIYNYFKNKDDILLAIIGEITEAETREMHFAEGAQVDFATFAQEYVQHRMAELEHGYPVMKLLMAETLVNPALGGEVYEKVYAPSFTVAERFFEQLITDKILPAEDPALLSRIFAAPLLGIFLLRMLGDPHVAAHWEQYSGLLAKNIANLFVTNADETGKKQTKQGEGVAAQATKKAKKKRKKS